IAGIFKNIQGLYGLTAKKDAEEILGGATTDSEATQSQNIEVVPLQIVRLEGEGTEQSLEPEKVRHASPTGRVLRSALPPPQRKRTSPQTIEGSGGNEKSAESTALVKRKRAPPQSPMVVC
ncbi:hypothetical protein Dimus_027237, partial [Dionaea muscipula]